MGGFLAGTGWLLTKGGVATRIQPYFHSIHDLLREDSVKRWVPALVFGIVLLVVTRIVNRPLVIPATIGIGLVVFAIGVLVTGSSLDEVRDGSGCSGRSPRPACCGRGPGTR